jgi:hypothetical protein
MTAKDGSIAGGSFGRGRQSNDLLCESIPENVERWRRSTAVGNQSTIKSSGPEANVYTQISHRAEGRNGNEFDDGVWEKLDFPPIFEEERAEFPKNNNNQHHISRFE